MITRALHRLLWQRLPRQARRRVLFGITRRAAARADPDAVPADPIIVVGCLRAATGLGESARLCYQALEQSGLDVRGIDVSALLRQPLAVTEFAFRDGHTLTGPGTAIVHVNAPLLPLVLLALGRRFLRKKWVVGYWAWELPTVPDEWVRCAPFVHEVWVPSRFVASAMAERFGSVPIRVVPHPVAQVLPEPSPVGRHGPFTALVVFDMGSSMARKNPLASIEAFRIAFGNRDDARIIVKIANGALYPPGASKLNALLAHCENAVFIDRTVSRGAMSDLYRQADCLVSLHRSEGFGLTVAEAMLHGLPCVVTDWSGTTDFVTAETGRLVDYRLIPAHDPQATYDDPTTCWADPSAATAAVLLRQLRNDAPEVGRKARTQIARLLDAESYASRIQSVLNGPGRTTPWHADARE
ncbi:MAG: glycosyltransferase family 4 protein [Hyphomicrobiales bacterium]|nr:glycosyltransferase family 4 protein [Hyphomicrobiales bacterium]